MYTENSVKVPALVATGFGSVIVAGVIIGIIFYLFPPKASVSVNQVKRHVETNQAMTSVCSPDGVAYWNIINPDGLSAGWAPRYTTDGKLVQCTFGVQARNPAVE